MIPRLANRTPRTRAVRANSGDPRLESLAAEFALLAQRRSRAIHQIETLDQQRAAAVMGFAKLQKRITWLMEHMSALSTDPREPVALEPEPAPPPAVQQYPAHHHAGVARPAKPVAPAHGSASPSAIGRKWIATQPPYTDHFSPPGRIRRP
jgi:hypothetical protein